MNLLSPQKKIICPTGHTFVRTGLKAELHCHYLVKSKHTFSLLEKDDTFEMQLFLEIWKSPWKLTAFLLSRAQALDR